MKREVRFQKEGLEFILTKKDMGWWDIEVDGIKGRISDGVIHPYKDFYIITIYRCFDIAQYIYSKIKKLNKHEDIYLSIPEEIYNEIKQIEKEVLEERIEEEKKKELKEWVWGIGGDSWKIRIWPVGIDTQYRQDLKEMVEFIERHQSEFEKLLREKSRPDEDTGGFYTLDGFVYYISHQDLMEIYKPIKEAYDRKKAEREMKEEERIKKAIEEAKRTGEKQVLAHWSEDCNDPNEDCDLDIVYQLIDGDGKISYKREHTW